MKFNCRTQTIDHIQWFVPKTNEIVCFPLYGAEYAKYAVMHGYSYVVYCLMKQLQTTDSNKSHDFYQLMDIGYTIPTHIHFVT